MTFLPTPVPVPDEDDLTALDAPPAVLDAYNDMAARLAGYLSTPIVELAAMLAPGAPVRTVPADRVIFATIAGIGDAGAQLVGGGAERARVTIIAGTVPVYLWSTGSGHPSESMFLPAGAGITIDARAPFAARTATPGVAATVTVIVEEYDP